MTIHPTTFNDRHTIKARHARLGKDARQQISNDASNRVARENIERIVVPENEFKLSSKIAQRSSEHAVKHSSS